MHKFNKEESIIAQHYQRFWGKPNAIYFPNYKRRKLPKRIPVLEFKPLSQGRDWIYATVGMSQFAMKLPIANNKVTERQVELFMYSREPNVELSDLIRSIAEYPFDSNTFLGPGHTLQRNSPITSDSNMSDILLLKPIGEVPEFEIIHIDQQRHATPLWMIPIYRSELLFIKQNGIDSLVKLFYQHGTDTSNFSRVPVK